MDVRVYADCGGVVRVMLSCVRACRGIIRAKTRDRRALRLCQLRCHQQALSMADLVINIAFGDL